MRGSRRAPPRPQWLIYVSVRPRFCRACTTVGAPGTAAGRYKRPFDLLLTALVAVAAVPVALAAAVAIRLEDGGPALYRQRRLGRGGRGFEMWKFRTMRVDAERRSGPVLAAERDPRTTRVGALLRRFHVDELPQLVNVLRNEMSLVGPRPERPELAARIARDLPAFGSRLAVRPGIAGLGQARGGYFASPRSKLRYDRLYMRRMGPLVDLWILALCVRRTVLGPGSRAAASDRSRRRTGHAWTRNGR